MLILLVLLGHPNKTLYKFLLVGLINTALGASVMFVAYNMLGLSYWLSSATNYTSFLLLRL